MNRLVDAIDLGEVPPVRVDIIICSRPAGSPCLFQGTAQSHVGLAGRAEGIVLREVEGHEVVRVVDGAMAEPVVGLELDPGWNDVNPVVNNNDKMYIPAARRLIEVAGVKDLRLKSSWLIVRGLGVYSLSVSPHVSLRGTKRAKRVPTAPMPGVSRLLHKPLSVRAAEQFNRQFLLSCASDAR